MNPPKHAPRAPRALAAIAADAALGRRAHCDPDTGALLRVLAASRLRGVTLQMGAASVALAAWIIDGMDITSRLLLLVDDDATAAAARPHLCNDIRVAVHAQAPVGFLRDVSRNRVDLVVVDDGRVDADLVEAGVALLNPGGLFCVLEAGGGVPAGLAAARALFAARADCLVGEMNAPSPVLVAVRTPEDSRPVRRGGRSGRQAAGRTPVANLR